jgi:DNA uptake protein ComE-like DNA-binding protein
MTTTQQAIGAIVRVLAFLTLLAFLALPMLPAGVAQTGLVDANTAPESELQKLPHMTPAIVKGLTEKRPFPSILELHQFLLDQKLTAEQAREFYGKAFVKINLNTGKREEFLLIPRVGSRMAAELMEYRPWKTWSQFDKEIGKYVGQQEVDRPIRVHSQLNNPPLPPALVIRAIAILGAGHCPH